MLRRERFDEPFNQPFDVPDFDHPFAEDEDSGAQDDDGAEPEWDERLEEGFGLLSLAEDDECADEDDW